MYLCVMVYVCMFVYMFVYIFICKYVCMHASMYVQVVSLLWLPKVIANNSLGKSDPVQADGFTYPPPPVPVINGSSNITVRIQLTLLPNHRFLVIAVEVSVIILN